MKKHVILARMVEQIVRITATVDEVFTQELAPPSVSGRRRRRVGSRSESGKNEKLGPDPGLNRGPRPISEVAVATELLQPEGRIIPLDHQGYSMKGKGKRSVYNIPGFRSSADKGAPYQPCAF